MNALTLENGAEEFVEGIKSFLQAYLPEATRRINASYSDGNNISAPADSDYVLMDPMLAFNYILEAGHFPAICISANSEDGNSNGENFTVEITGYVCEDDWEKIEAQNLRMAKAVKSTLFRDISIGGICAGFIGLKIDYIPAHMKDSLTFKAFQVIITCKN